MAGRLADMAGGEPAFDPDPAGYPSPWRTYRYALQSTPVDATHRVVIQDDAELCVNFRAALDLVVAARPDDLIVLWVGGHPREHVRALFRACELDETFAVLSPDRWVPTVAVVWPVAMIEPVLTWVEAQHYPVQFRADDEIVGRATRALGLRVVCTVPSLVEHPDLVESITGYRRNWGGLDKNRVAACFINCDPLEIDWR